MPRPSDPHYIRLHDRIALHGSLHDVETGFSISGLDVQPFPSDDFPERQEFVRRNIRAGGLEEASKAEYQELHDSDHGDVEVKLITEVETPWQEGQMRDRHRAARNRLRQQREKQSQRLRGEYIEDEEDEELEEEVAPNPKPKKQRKSSKKKSAKGSGGSDEDSNDDGGDEDEE